MLFVSCLLMQPQLLRFVKTLQPWYVPCTAETMDNVHFRGWGPGLQMTSALLYHFRQWKRFSPMQLSSVFLFLLFDFKHASRTLLKIKPRNKDDLAMKKLTKMTIYTDKCIFSGNIWCVSVIRVNTLENVICQGDFGKD